MRFDTFPYRFEIKREYHPFRFYEIWIYLAGDYHTNAIPLKYSAFADLLPISCFKTKNYEELVANLGTARQWLHAYMKARGTAEFKSFIDESLKNVKI